MPAKLSEFRAAVVARIAGDSALQTLFGVDENSDFPLYEAHSAVALTVTKAMVYELRTSYDAELSAEGRREAQLEITAEVKPGTTSPADFLDEVEERLDLLLHDWRPVTANYWSVGHCVRSGMGQPDYDVSGQGFESRIWLWELVLNDI